MALVMAGALAPYPSQEAAAQGRHAGLSITLTEGLLTLRASEHPWPAVLEALEWQTGIDIDLTPPPEGTLTASIENVDVERALRLLFGAAASIVYIYRGPSEPAATPVLERVWIAVGGADGSAAVRIHRAMSPMSPATGRVDAVRGAGTLPHADLDARLKALEAVVDRGDGSGVDEVAEILRDDSEAEVRARAVKTLTRIGTAQALEALRHGLGDPEPGIRVSVVAAIASFEGARAVALLREALRDRDEQVRVAAAAALQTLGA